MKAQAGLIIRRTPDPTGIQRTAAAAGMSVLVDTADKCRVYGSDYRYVRIIQVGKWVADEPLYAALERVRDLPDGTEKRVTAYLK